MATGMQATRGSLDTTQSQLTKAYSRGLFSRMKASTDYRQYLYSLSVRN